MEQARLTWDETPGCLLSADPASWQAHPEWASVLEPFWASDTGRELRAFLQTRLEAGAVVYPPQPLRALALTPLSRTRVVILGQDPYHGPGQAEGLAFSVAPGVRLPPSLRNIFKELAREVGEAYAPPASGSLTHWADQGVLLLNTSLTVEQGEAGSHAKRGWEVLTARIVDVLSRDSRPKAFLLWGGHAQAFEPAIDAGAHAVFKANHPSPLSALRGPQPFIGCGHFGAVNRFLVDLGGSPVAWAPKSPKTMA